ncbi:MAG TPA: amino acid permease [Bacteroidaceae bacterium]|nr:amino acid permease [Bacteroidaceae bacterium]
MPVPLKKSFGTAPVFFTAISTILGAILFLRFGFAVGTLGFWGVILLILLGHMVSIPTALALSEIATNKRVEGGGEYFIISRSFGLNIGATIGFALFLSQAISVAFYIIAFTEAFEFFFNWVAGRYNIILPRQVISIPVMLGLSVLILRKGANLGVKALYFVVAILFLSIVLFFLGNTEHAEASNFSLLNAESRNMDSFFIVFAIIFPAFTGMTAGVGLSGDLKKPGKSIPIGTIAATLTGMVVYLFIVYKLAISATPSDLVEKQLIMADIALGGRFIIPLGLAASTLSSAIGSVMVAPRTLQALAGDASFPSKRINRFLFKGRGETNEPFNATLVTVIIALFIVSIGNVNMVAGIISMFFLVTYGSLCLISFLHHFGSSPSYRPSFKSRWFLSLMGFIISVWIMFRINTWYALAAIMIMVLLYIYLNNYHKGRKGLSSIFTNALFQLNRSLQVYLQQTWKSRGDREWRPSAICISRDSFKRDRAFQLLNWISYKYGFGTYIHLIEGYYSKATNSQSAIELEKLIKHYKGQASQVYVDTLISPSYTSAIAQSIQLPGISGMENNMVVLEYDRHEPSNLNAIVENFSLVNAGNFDVCIFSSVKRQINYGNGIHVWIRSTDFNNSHLMILMSFIIQGHPAWKKSPIVVYEICSADRENETRTELNKLVKDGRLPITSKNIQIIIKDENRNSKSIIKEYSESAALIIIGFHSDQIRHDGEKIFEGYDDLGNILFVNAKSKKEIT